MNYILNTFADPTFLSAFLFFVGIAIGSFLNVVVLRFEKGEQATGRSHCMHCGKKLTWKELIPLFSYVVQGGKCVACKGKLSIQYPLVELGTGILFTLVLLHLAPTGLVNYVNLVVELIIWSFFMTITVYDFRTKLIPNEFSYALAGITFAYMFIFTKGAMPPVSQLLAGPVLFLPFYLLWKMSDGRWLGLGDGKLAISIGWFLGLSKGGTAILFAVWIGAGVSLLLMGIQRILNMGGEENKLTLKSEVPFGPFLVLGTFLVYTLGMNLFNYF